MKTLSVLLSLALLAAADQLAGSLDQAGNLPVDEAAEPPAAALLAPGGPEAFPADAAALPPLPLHRIHVAP